MIPPKGLVLDLFAGPGGWSVPLHRFGVRDVGLEWDEWACRTRAAAGLLTIRTNVAMYPVHVFAGRVWGFIASPPCQAWSMAGKRLGWSTSRSSTGRLPTSLPGSTPAPSSWPPAETNAPSSLPNRCATSTL